MSLDVELSRHDRTYRPGETIQGKVTVVSPSALAHNGVVLTMEGILLMEVTTGIKKAFTLPKPSQIAFWSRELAKPGKMPSGTTEFPFEFRLEPLAGQRLHETYHGNNISIRYVLRCLCARGFAKRNLSHESEFIVQMATLEEHPPPSVVPFAITSAEQTKPKLKIKGKLNGTTCSITGPITGELTVERSLHATIKSISLHLMRIETCGLTEGFIREASEIEEIQIADGDPCPNLPLLVYLLFPRLYTCPTVHTAQIKIEFPVDVVVMLTDGTVLRRDFPLLLIRKE